MKLYKLTLGFFGLFFSMIVLTGCPYESKVPLTETGVEIPKNFIGKWVEVTELSKESNPNFYQLDPINKKEFMLNKIEYSSYSQKYDTTFYMGRLSLINNVYFMTIKKYEPIKKNEEETTDPFEEEKEGYYTYRVRSEKGFIKIDELSTDITEVFNNSTEFYDFVQKNMSNELLYSSTFYNNNKSEFTLFKLNK
jgi:hypothetical protein